MDITLFNAYTNPITEGIEYKRTYIYDINWQAQQAVTVNEKGLLSANKIECYIPFSSKVEGNKTYISPGDFSRLVNEGKEKHFTFKKEDIIVKGLVNFQISNNKGHKLKDLLNKFEAGTIISVITNDFGSLNLRHWEIGAK